MWTEGWRDRVWADLDQPWDIIIVGGGITGAGILHEAVQSGLKALLLEGQDFASGTSSRSSKLVHGGLRYLRNGQIRTTMLSVKERKRLLHHGKGLISPLGFLYVAYDGDRLPLPLFGLGLAVYDLLGMQWGHKRYATDDLLKLAPGLEQRGLKGGYRYFDAQTDDARLVFRVIREAVKSGGQALNYARVEGLLRRADGRVCGLAVRDVAGEGLERTAEVQATAVVNATGSAADRLRAQIGGKNRLRCLRGSHLIFPAGRFPLLRAVSFAHPVDGRPVFAIPWEGVTLFGTTDVDHLPSDAAEPAMDGQELDYLMVALEERFPGLALAQADIQGTLAGIRAVIDTGKANPSKESREHVLWLENGLLTIAGGKLTTFRVMAQDALRALRSQFSGKLRLKSDRVLARLSDDLPPDGLTALERLRLSGRYGADLVDLLNAARENELTPIDPGLGSRALWAELRWATRAEGVVHLDDLLLRRVRLGLLLPQGGLPWLDRIRPIIQPELGWADARWAWEVDRYCRRWRAFYSPLVA